MGCVEVVLSVGRGCVVGCGYYAAFAIVGGVGRFYENDEIPELVL